MRAAFWTLAIDVAKWLCQNRVIRSRSGWGVKIIRYSQIAWSPVKIGGGPELGGHRVEGRFEVGGRACRRAAFGFPDKSRSMLAEGPSCRSRWRTAQGAAKPARRCRCDTLARSQGCAAAARTAPRPDRDRPVKLLR